MNSKKTVKTLAVLLAAALVLNPVVPAFAAESGAVETAEIQISGNEAAEGTSTEETTAAETTTATETPAATESTTTTTTTTTTTPAATTPVTTTTTETPADDAAAETTETAAETEETTESAAPADIDSARNLMCTTKAESQEALEALLADVFALDPTDETAVNALAVRFCEWGIKAPVVVTGIRGTALYSAAAVKSTVSTYRTSLKKKAKKLLFKNNMAVVDAVYQTLIDDPDAGAKIVAKSGVTPSFYPYSGCRLVACEIVFHAAKVRDEKAAVVAVLDDIRQNAQLGTAGATLKIATCAAHLGDFGLFSRRSKKNITADVTEYMAALSADEKELFIEQLKAVGTGKNASYARFVDSSAEEIRILNDAGVIYSGYPYNYKWWAKVNYLLKAAGAK